MSGYIGAWPKSNRNTSCSPPPQVNWETVRSGLMCVYLSCQLLVSAWPQPQAPQCKLELETKVKRRFAKISQSRKVPTSAFTLKTLLRHLRHYDYAETGINRLTLKGWAALRNYANQTACPLWPSFCIVS